MRHGDKIKNLSRTKAHREALLANLSCQLIQHKRIVTTLAKAKALRVYVEPLITKSKENTTHQRRIVFGHLQDKEAIKELFDNIAGKVGGRPGGYTRIIKLGIRPGDAAEKAMIELVDYNEIYGKGVGEEKSAAKKTRRRGGSGKKKAEAAEATEVALAENEEIALEAETAKADDTAAVEPKAEEVTATATAAETTEETKEEGNEEAKA